MAETAAVARTTLEVCGILLRICFGAALSKHARAREQAKPSQRCNKKALVLVQDSGTVQAVYRRAVRDANDDIPAPGCVAPTPNSRGGAGREHYSNGAEDAERACNGLRRAVQPDTADAACAGHRFRGTGEPDSIGHWPRDLDYAAHRDRP